MGPSSLLGCFGRRRSTKDKQSVSVATTRSRSKEKPTDVGDGGRTNVTAANSARPAETAATERRQQQKPQQHRHSRQHLAAADAGGCEHQLPVVPAAFGTSRLPASDDPVAAASAAVTCNNLSNLRCQSVSLQPVEQRLAAQAELADGQPSRADSCDKTTSRAGHNAQPSSVENQTESNGHSDAQVAEAARRTVNASHLAPCSVDSPLVDLSAHSRQCTEVTSEGLVCCCLHQNIICRREETLEVLLEPWEEERCAGFTLFDCCCNSYCQLDGDSSRDVAAQRCHQPAFATIEQGSSAARSGVIFAGDRLLAINGQSTKDKAASDVAGLLSQFHCLGCTLEIAFDVQELVGIEQGVYTVKMLKSRDSDLGLTVAPLSDVGDGSGLTVVDVKKGSTAYRQGCIRTGDRLLSTNDGAFACCGSDDCILTLIQDLEGPVSLKFLRVACQTVTSPHITYTVQLEDSRWSELGVTLDGAQDGGSPILISHIRPGSVAAHAGLLHVGDRILAVNGVSVVGCRPSQAAQLLQLQSKSIALQVQHTVSSAGYDCISSVAMDFGADCRNSSDSDSTRMAARRTITGVPPRTVTAAVAGGIGNSSMLDGYGGGGNRATKHRRVRLVGRRGSDEASDCSTQPLELNLRCNDDEHGFGFSLVGRGSGDDDSDHGDYGNCCDSRRGSQDGYGRSGCYVIAVQQGGAAERAGLQAYDRLIGVDGTSTAGLTYDEVVRRVQAASAATGARSINLQVGRCRTGGRATLDERESVAADWLVRDGSSSTIAAEQHCTAATDGGNGYCIDSREVRFARQ